MAFDPAKPVRWGLPDVLLGLLSFLAGNILFTLVALAGVLLASGGGDPQRAVEDNSGVLLIASLAGSWVGTVGFLVLISRIKGQGSLRRDFGFAFSWWDPLIGFGGALVTLVVSGAVQALVGLATGTEPESNADAIFGGVRDDRILLIAMVVLASVGAPIVEELLFRGLALRAIEKRFGAVAGVVGSGVLFGIVHYQGGALQPTVIAGIAVYGVIFALLTRVTGRLGPAVFTHVWVNTAAAATMLLTGTVLVL